MFDDESYENENEFNGEGEGGEEMAFDPGDMASIENFISMFGNYDWSQGIKLWIPSSDAEWEALSEMEKEDYISRLPPEKTRAGGEEMSDRDCAYPWSDIREKMLEIDSIDPTILSKILSEMTFDGEAVEIKAETKTKLAEHGVELDPCECDEDEEDEQAETDESSDALNESDTHESEKEDLPSTERVLQDTETTLRDLQRIVG